MATRAAEDVLVIGAGPAGINSAYALEQQGISYKVIDRAAIVGSTWNSLYPSLTLNTSRFYSHMPHKRFPLSYGMFPTGKQYYNHLAEFVHQNHFNIQLEVEVHRVVPEGKLWRVETSEGDYLYSAVISATGIWNNPIMPTIKGMEAFSGTLIHAHNFRDPQQVAGERVLVVGNGPSGIDIAVAAGETAAHVDIAIRSGVKLSRRYPFGLPVHAWLLLGEHLPDGWCHWLLDRVKGIGYGDLSHLGLENPDAGAGGMTGYQGRELVDAVSVGKVHPKPEPIAFDARGATFTDGQYHDYDSVIMATGYLPVLHQYLDIEMQYSDEEWQTPSPCDWMIGPNGLRGWPLRDTSEHPNGRQILGHAGLYLVGVYYKGKGAMFNMTVEAAIAAEQIKTYLAGL